MQFVYGSLTVQPRRHQTQSMMETELERAGGKIFRIDTSAGYARNFWSLRFHDNLEASAELGGWSVALTCGETGIDPQVLFVPTTKRLFLGADNSVEVIDLEHASAAETVPLESPLYSISHLAERDELLVVYETGLRLLDMFGHSKWVLPMPDVLSETILRNADRLDIRLMNKQLVTVDLSNGSVVNS